jgi:hypothetical protein
MVLKNMDSTEAISETKDTIPRKDANAPVFSIRKRIGCTTYEVEARFNPASRETLDDKILRLVRGEAMKDSGGTP